MILMNAYDVTQPRSIQLSPFFHQVGGHSSMFQYDQTTLCKVLEAPELDFYQSMPESLKTFTPEFRGSIAVQYCEDALGHIKLVARPQTNGADSDVSVNEQDDVQSSEAATRKSVQLRCSEDGHIDYSSGLGMDVGNYEQGKITTSTINPWSLQLCIKNAERLHRQFVGDENRTISLRYILLENVTARFCHPCILDLKMGKRQYADIDSDKKRQSKIQKCELSTSSTLGVRLCGMQVYQIEQGRYIFTDKYRGRVLTVDGFRSALVEYFDNGQTKRLDILPAILERLEALYETIDFLSKYRFYSGSLLIVYDGLPSSDLIDIRMIDFAHSIRAGAANDDLAGPDRDYLFGLERLIDVFREISNERKKPSIIDVQ